MTDEHLDRPERRSFLKGLAAAGSTVALAGLADGVQAASEAATAENPREAKASGYRLTSHVLSYYKTLRF
jgi:anaerobic selenocysteine-containing dehydrogenase